MTVSKERHTPEDSDGKIEFIASVVEEIRNEKRISPTPGSKLEGSCIGARGGEMANMFWAQLVYTTNGTGEWRTLSNPTILEGVYEYVSSLDLGSQSKK